MRRRDLIFALGPLIDTELPARAEIAATMPMREIALARDYDADDIAEIYDRARALHPGPTDSDYSDAALLARRARVHPVVDQGVAGPGVEGEMDRVEEFNRARSWVFSKASATGHVRQAGGDSGLQLRSH